MQSGTRYLAIASYRTFPPAELNVVEQTPCPSPVLSGLVCGSPSLAVHGALARGRTSLARCGPLAQVVRGTLARLPHRFPRCSSAAGVRASAGALATDRAAAPGIHGAALRLPGGRPPRCCGQPGPPWVPGERPGLRTLVAGTVRAGETAHARAWQGWQWHVDSVGATCLHDPRELLRSVVGRSVFY